MRRVSSSPSVARMADPTHASPPDHRAGLRAVIPLSEETVLSTRGQHLPSLLLGPPALTRRPSTLRNEPREIDNGDLERVHSVTASWAGGERHDKHDGRLSAGAAALMAPQMRSQRLIGNSNPRYRWEQYFKTDEELKKMKKPLRQYYERNNFLIQQYLYIDRLLDSSLPHSLIDEYNHDPPAIHVPPTITEESPYGSMPPSPQILGAGRGDNADHGLSNGDTKKIKVKRTPKALYKLPEESTPLLITREDDPERGQIELPRWSPEEESDSGDKIVTLAIYINLVANTILLILKIIVTVLTSSLSVLASLVDAALDFLSTAIVWTTTRMISEKDMYAYPVGRRRLEPIGVLVFSIIMVTSFFQVALEGIQRMSGSDHSIVKLTIPAVAIMASTIIIKFLCWLWCRLIRNSSVQALAQDAMTDVVFNFFSIIFPLGGLFLSLGFSLSAPSPSCMRHLGGTMIRCGSNNVT